MAESGRIQVRDVEDRGGRRLDAVDILVSTQRQIKRVARHAVRRQNHRDGLDYPLRRDVSQPTARN